MKRCICFILVVCLMLSSCASAGQYQNQRNDGYKKAEEELKIIDSGCKKKNSITESDLKQIADYKKHLSKNQYNYSLCFHGAKYISFQSYFEDKVAWKQNLQKNARTLHSLYLGRISKKAAETSINKNNSDFLKKENSIVLAKIHTLQERDRKGNQAIIAGIAVVALVAVAAYASNASSSNSYTGYSPSSGSCMCPYHYDSAGRRCGLRSAYSRSGGASPACY